MIYALVGRPRSGKSYEAVVFHIIPAIKQGRKVITNIPVNIERLRKVFGDAVDLIEVREGEFNNYQAKLRPFSAPADYQTDWRNDENQGPLFIIDEAHMVLGRTLNDEILYFYSMHGHYGIDIILVTQNLRKINKDIKDMIELTYYCVKNTHLGTDKTYTKKNFLGFETKNPVSEETRTYDKNYFPFYTSHTASNSAVKEAQAGDTKSVYDTWSTKLGKIFIILGAVMFFVIIGFSFFGDDDTPKQAEPVTNVETKTAPDTEPDKKPVERKRSSNAGFGLLEAYQFHVSGWAKQLVMTRTGSDMSKSFYRIYVDVYLDDKFQFTLKHSELYKLGYNFKELADCVYQITYFDASRLVMCKERDVEEEKQKDSALKLPSII